LMGDLNRLINIAGSIAGQSTMAGVMSLLKGLAGQIAGQSTASAKLAMLYALAGLIEATSGLTGELEGLGVAYNIYRGQDGIIDYETVIATMSAEQAQVTITDQQLPANTIWHYIRRRVTACCEKESPDSPACIVRIDSDGDMIENIPNVPSDLSIEGLSNGRFRLRWRYSNIDEEIQPTGFNIYMDSGEGFDFETPDDTVSFGFGGLGEFEWTSEPLTHGLPYRFCVRSYKTGAGETQNTNYVSGTADAEGPDAITGLIASWSEV